MIILLDTDMADITVIASFRYNITTLEAKHF